MIAFDEKTPFIPEDVRFDEEDAGKWGGEKLHESGRLLPIQYAQEMLAVIIIFHRFCESRDLLRRNSSHAIGDFFKAGDFKSLSLFDGLDEVGSLEQ